MSEFTTLVVRGLASHPRKIIVDGAEYEVQCSADGHVPAQVDELATFVNNARAGELRGMTKKDIRLHAQKAKDESNAMLRLGYDF